MPNEERDQDRHDYHDDDTYRRGAAAAVAVAYYNRTISHSVVLLSKACRPVIPTLAAKPIAARQPALFGQRRRLFSTERVRR